MEAESRPQGGSFKDFPEIDLGIGVALPAENQGQPVATSGAPDVEDPAFAAERSAAAVADHNSFVFVADFAGSSFCDRNHENVPDPPKKSTERIKKNRTPRVQSWV